MLITLLLAAQASVLPAVCSRPDVDSIRVPLRHGDAASPTFTWRYQYIRAAPSPAAPSTPTVIVLPGGPGQAAIGNAEGSLPLGAIPSTVHRIYTDPRGTGCNAVEPLADTTTLTTESLARDVIALIKVLKLDNVILYGASYGTVLATTTAGLIEREGITKPRAVVLEGVVGRAFPDFATYMSAFSREWRRVQSTLPNEWGSRLARTPLPYGYTPQQWGFLLGATLILGDLARPPFDGPVLEYALNGIDRYHQLKEGGSLAQMTKADSAAMAYAERSMGIFGGFAPPPLTPSRAALFKRIGCSELWGDWKSGRALRDGELVAEGANLCAPSTSKSRPYDSADWQLTVPIYYFQGPYDPTSTLDGARYHFDSQARAHRTFVLVDGASHAPLTGGLHSCAARLWEEMVHARDLNQGTFRGCRRAASVERRSAGSR